MCVVSCRAVAPPQIRLAHAEGERLVVSRNRCQSRLRRRNVGPAPRKLPTWGYGMDGNLPSARGCLPQDQRAGRGGRYLCCGRTAKLGGLWYEAPRREYMYTKVVVVVVVVVLLLLLLLLPLLAKLGGASVRSRCARAV